MSLGKYIIRTLIVVIPGVFLITLGVCIGNKLSFRASLLTIVLTMLCGICIGILSAYLNHKKFIAPIKGIVNHIHSLQEGNLHTRTDIAKSGMLKGIAISLNEMSDAWQIIINKVDESAQQVAALSEELSAEANQVAESSNQVTNTIHKVASETERQLQSMEESFEIVSLLSSGSNQIAENAQSVSTSSSNSLHIASEGNEKIQKAVMQMNSIQQTVNKSAAIITELGERSKEIGQIVKVITEIADQTNLLALNAAIEAARAGDHGKGFAVVADEVRKLAEQSALSSEQITRLIQATQLETSNAVQSMGQATREVSEGIAAVHFAGAAFESIQESIAQVTKQLQEVSSASDQMSSGVSQIVISMQEMTEVSENNVAGTQTVSAVAEQQLISIEEITKSTALLATMSEELRQLTMRFNNK
ncbi:methyl-accepting chemotaxis protein [Bacillus sp. FJAT-49736]|uniref:methyl-accepting chemotaxis protein n=1 Tax=Bacillus sp. FJAT-49736 TaxID=2833582 RepID=UPI001BC8CD70|nr:methyl-accepting chemotaxis protein [Bacillus sp. FJAT-49736]MBS4175121.1 methyl-accepting chemotaxis protein [Bacillus sp. FJAT-49736]